jgi:PD-(D/E)XK endonuclease
MSVCPICGTMFQKKRRSHRYCSRVCQLAAWKRPPSGLPPSTVGTMAELATCNNLLGDGYSVYRSITPNSPFDLVAYRDGKVRLIEVRTGFLSPSSEVAFKKYVHEGASEYAVHLRDQDTIIYLPTSTGASSV